MAKYEVLEKNFEKIGMFLDPDVLTICTEICDRQKIDEAALVDSWVAFSMSVLSTSVPPTPDKLIFFEQKMFGDPIFSTPKQSLQGPRIIKKDMTGTVALPGTSRTPKRNIVEVEPEEQQQSVTSPVAQVFSPNSSNGQTKSARPAPTRNGDLFPFRLIPPRHEPLILELEPAQLSSSADFFTEGETVITYGQTAEYLPPVTFEPTIDLVQGKLNKTWATMIDILYDSFTLRKNFSDDIVNVLLEKYNLPTPAKLDNLPIESSVYVGKIVQELGKIDDTDLLIESLDDPTDQVILDIAGIKNYSIFPGQIIAFRGVSRGASRIVATQIYTDARGPVPNPPEIDEPFSIMVAAGPFSPFDYVDVDITHALIKHAKKIQPTYLFLIGPFMDTSSQLLSVRFNLYSNQTFKSSHAKMMEKFSKQFAGMKTKVFYLTSSKDPTALPVYPTPIVDIEGEYSHGVLPDPSLLDINGFIFGFTSADIVFFLSHQEFSNCKGGNRIGRLATHLLNQQSFYPLETGAFDETNLDYTRLFHQARIPVIPHVLVLPSELGCYAKNVDGCVVVNPEKCIKGRRGNNFALIEVRPNLPTETWSTETHVSTKIVRI